MELEDARLLRAMTIQESVSELLALQAEFEPWLRQTEPLYRQERARDVARLQARLHRLDKLKGPTVKHLIESVLDLQKRLDKSGIPSLLIGGLAVSVWGKPRLTRDIHFKVLATRDDAPRLVKALGRSYKPLQGEPVEALRLASFAFFVDRRGSRVDLLLADNAFDIAAISRGATIELAPKKRGRVCTAEDLVIYKMISERPQDRVDVESIIRRQGDRLENSHVVHWLRDFEAALDASNLVSEYRRLRRRSPG